MSLSRSKKTAKRRRWKTRRAILAAAELMEEPHLVLPPIAPRGMVYLVDLATLRQKPPPPPPRFEMRFPMPVLLTPLRILPFLGGL